MLVVDLASVGSAAHASLALRHAFRRRFFLSREPTATSPSGGAPSDPGCGGRSLGGGAQDGADVGGLDVVRGAGGPWSVLVRTGRYSDRLDAAVRLLQTGTPEVPPVLVPLDPDAGLPDSAAGGGGRPGQPGGAARARAVVAAAFSETHMSLETPTKMLGAGSSAREASLKAWRAGSRVLSDRVVITEEALQQW
jgi:hypothetical protein